MVKEHDTTALETDQRKGEVRGKKGKRKVKATERARVRGSKKQKDVTCEQQMKVVSLEVDTT